MTEPSAKVIADSIWQGHRLTTLEVVMHRLILSEMNTHRVFSRNSASSRAIPMSVTMKQYMADPAYPISWPAEKAGMQGGAELEGQDLTDAHLLLWEIANQTRMSMQNYLDAHPEAEHRLHKSVLNRYLEPFRFHTAVISSTEWDGFWRQRCSPLAQPEMRVVAEAMKAAYDASTPQELSIGDAYWHLPYISEEDVDLTYDETDEDGRGMGTLKKVSVARCARVSLDRQGEGSIEECLKLYNRLKDADPEHSSPFEHVATPCTCRTGSTGKIHLGNFHGWDQLRHTIFGR